MSKQIVDIGVQGNDGTGDSIRESFRKVNENFTELYAVFGVSGKILFTSLGDAPASYSRDQIIMSSVAGDKLTARTLTAGDGITINGTYGHSPNDTEITISATNSGLLGDRKPALGYPLNINLQPIGRVPDPSALLVAAFNNIHPATPTTIDQLAISKGYADRNYVKATARTDGSGNILDYTVAPAFNTRAEPLIPQIADPGYDSTLTGNYIATEAVQRKDVVYRGGDTMSGPLILSDHPTPLEGYGTPNGTTDLQAATKFYVDNQVFSSGVNLYVSTTSGDDLQQRTPPGKEGRFWQYSYKTIGAAALAAENLISLASQEPGPYRQRISYTIGPDQTFSTIQGVTLVSGNTLVAGYQDAFDLLELNKEFIQKETIAYINNKYVNALDYDRVKCQRDVGLILDAVGYDLVLGTTYNVTTAATQYFVASANKVASSQLIQTIDAIKYARDTVLDFSYVSASLSTYIGSVIDALCYDLIFQSNFQTTQVGLSFASAGTDLSNSEISQVIQNLGNSILALSQVQAVTAAVTSFTTNIANLISTINTGNLPVVSMPSLPSTTTGQSSARDLLLNNIKFIQAEAISFLNAEYPNLPYNQINFKTSIQYIIWSIVYDMMYGGNSKSVSSAKKYWAETSLTVTATESATDTITISDTTVLGVGEPITFNGTSFGNIVSGTVYYVAAILDGTHFSISSTRGGSVFQQANASGSLTIQNRYIAGIEVYPTIAAIDYIKSLASQIVTNSIPVTLYQQSFKQYKNDTLTGGSTVTTGLTTNFESIEQIITNNANVSVTAPTVSAGASALKSIRTYILDNKKSEFRTASITYVNNSFSVINDTNTLSSITTLFNVVIDLLTLSLANRVNPTFGSSTRGSGYNDAKTLLMSNLDFIADQTVGWLTTNHPTYVTDPSYDETAFKRNIKDFIEAAAYELVYSTNGNTVNSASISRGLYLKSIIYNDLTTTWDQTYIDAIAVALDLTSKSAVNQSPIQSYSSTVQFKNLLLTGGAVATDSISTTFSLITNIAKGNTVPSIVQPILTSYSATYQSARDLIVANTEDISVNTTVYLDSKYKGGFSYDETICSRDVGLITDGLAIDIITGGTWQSVFAGKSYYRNASAKAVAIGTQYEQTVDALKFHGDLCLQVLNQSVASRYQTVVPQYFNTLKNASAGAKQALTTNFNIILSIVQNGIGAAPIPSFGTGIWQVTIDNGANGYVDQGVPGNVDIIPAKVIVGVDSDTVTGSGAYASIVKYVPGVTSSNDVLSVRLTKPGFFKIGEQVEFGETVRDLHIVIQVESGIYYEDYPIRVAQNVSIRGDEFRRTIVRPRDRKSQSPWRKVFFYRDAVIDALELGPYDYSTDYTTSIASSTAVVGGTNGKIAITLGTGQVPSSWIGKIFMDDYLVNGTAKRGRAIIDSVSGNVMNCSVIYPFNSASTIAYGSWHIYGTINYGRHYLTDPLDITSDAKNNKLLDVLLCNDAVRISNCTFQGHGGFIMVLDPDGQIKTKSPYGQVCSSFSQSTNHKRFAGGQFIDGFSGRVFGTIIDVKYDAITSLYKLNNGSGYTNGTYTNVALDSIYTTTTGHQATADIVVSGNQVTSVAINNGGIGYNVDDVLTCSAVGGGTGFTVSVATVTGVGNGITVTVQGTTNSGLDVRPPQPPCAFFVQGSRYQINDVVSFDSTTATVVLTMDVGTPYNIAAFYNNEKCSRDVGLIIDAATYDMVIGSNFQSIAGARAYTRINAATVINTQKTLTLAGFNKARDLAVASITAGATYNSARSILTANMNIVNTVIDQGLAAAPAISYPTAGAATANAAKLRDNLIANRSFVQQEITAWIASNYVVKNIPNYNALTCQRDVGYIIDAMIYDIMYGGNSMTYDAAVSYYLGAVAQAKDETTILRDTYQQMKVILQQIAVNTLITRSTGNTATQTINGSYVISNSDAAYLKISTLIEIVKDYVYDGDFDSATTRTAPTIVSVGLDTNLLTARTNVVDSKTTIQTSVINYLNTGGGLGINIEGGGNKSMLANDFAMINDLGYAIVAYNGGVTEQVSTFTYYCHTHYWAGNGGQIRSVAGSNAHGDYALRATGYDTTEKPDSVNIAADMAQTAKVYRLGSTASEMTPTIAKQALAVWIINYSYIPYNISELEIDHTMDGGVITRYEITSIEHTSITVNGQNVLKLNLSTAGNNGTSSSGLTYALYDGQLISIRSLQNLKFYNIDNVKPTRPSTALQYVDNLADIYRVIAYNLTESTGELLAPNIAVLQTDSSFNYYKFVTDLINLSYVDPDFSYVTTASSGDGTTATISFASQTIAPFAVGDKVIVQGVTPIGYNGSYIVTGQTNSSVSYANTTTGSMTIPGRVGFKTMGGTVADYKVAVIPITVQTTIDQINKGIYVTSYAGRTHRITGYTAPVVQLSAQYVSGGVLSTTMIISSATGTIKAGMRVSGGNGAFTTQTVVTYTPPVSPAIQGTIVLSGVAGGTPSGTLYFDIAVPAYISIDANPVVNIAGDGSTINAFAYVSKTVPATGKKFVTYDVAWNPANLPIVDNFYKISGQANTLYNGYHRISGSTSRTQLTVADTTGLSIGMVMTSVNPLAYIPNGTTIQSIDSTNQFTVSPACWVPTGCSISSTVVAVIDRLDITKAGSGYSTPPTIIIGRGGSINGNFVNGETSGAIATCKIDTTTGAITSITIVQPGYGYTTTPIVYLSETKGDAQLTAVLTATATQNTTASSGVITNRVTLAYDSDPGDWVPGLQITLTSFNAKSGSGPYLVTINIPTQATAPQVGSFYTLSGNSNPSYNGTWVATASSTTTIQLSFPTDPGSFGTSGTINLQGKVVSNAGIAKATSTTYNSVAGYSVSMTVPTTSTAATGSWRQVFGNNNTLYNGFHQIISASGTNKTLFYPYNPDYVIATSGGVKSGAGPYFVTYSLPTQAGAPNVGSTWIVSGNSNSSYNITATCTASTTTGITLSYGASNPGTYGTGTTYVTLVQDAMNVVTYGTKTGTGPYLVTLNINTQAVAPLIGSYWSITGNSNSLYNRLVIVTASTTSTITVSYSIDPGSYGTGTTTLTNQTFTIEANTNALSTSLGINKPFETATAYTVRAGYAANTYGQVTTRISTCRVTGHDLLDIGTGSYSTTNYPYQIYGNPAQSRNQANEVYEEGVGRVFYVTTDQNGIFRVGRFFTVDQGTGTVTFSASIALSNLDGLGFKRGVVISEFSTDTSMTNNAPEIVPVQSAVRGYIDKRLGLDHGGGVVASSSLIGPGYLALNGQLAMKGSLNMGTFGIGNLATPTANTDATTKIYVDTAIANVSTLAKLQDVVLSGQAGGDTWVYDTSLSLSINGAFGTGNAITFQFANPNSYTFKTGQQIVVTGIVETGGNPVPYNGTYSVISSTSTTVIVAGTSTNTYSSGGNIQASAWKNVTLPTGDVNITYNSTTKTLTTTIQASKIVNSMVSASAAIDQSKLNLVIAGLRSSAPTGTAAQIQAASGLASFDTASFTNVNGFVGLKAGGVVYSSLANISDKTLLGNFTGAAAYPREISAGTIVTAGDGIKNASFSYGSAGTFVMQTVYDGTATANNTYSLQKTTTTGEINSLVKTTNTGDISASGYISATGYINGNQIKIDGYKVIDTSSTTLQLFTPGGYNFATSIGTASNDTITAFTGTVDVTAGTLKSKSLTTGLATGAGSDGTITGQWSLLSSSQIDFTAGTLKSTTLTTGTDTNPGTIQGYWSLSGTSRLQATYADLAEYYEGDQEYEPGTVLIFGGDKEVTTTVEMNDTRSAGIVTTNPAYIMNQEQTGIKVCVALAGRVPCKVVGRVRKGDLLTTSATAGYAVKATNPTLGSIIGKALENKDYGEAGVIQVAVGRV
jgi:hypothetical protein